MAQVDLQGPAGRLEGLHEGPADAPFAAVVCHPHPRLGGTLHNHATYHLARAVRARGGATLRFNFRGVGRSQGSYDRGKGEVDDARAALAWLRAARPGVPLLACGFSFGAWAALRAGANDPATVGLVLAGLALRSVDLELVRDASELRRVEQPLAVVQATGDQFGTPEEVTALLGASIGPRRVDPVAGCTHLFTEDLPAFHRTAEAALAWVLAEAAR